MKLHTITSRNKKIYKKFIHFSPGKKTKQLTNMRSFLQKLEKNMLNCRMKTIN